jgi:membrane associated rhomboid family serine protease
MNDSAIIMAALVFIVYGGVFWGLVPTGDAKVSFEAHLVGLLLGLVMVCIHNNG